MTKLKTVMALAVMMLASTAAMAQKSTGFGLDDVKFSGRLGYALGGTMPHGMPSSIRSLHSYKLKTNLSAGFDAYKPVQGRWGLITGVRLENKGMEIDASVKNYRMEITRGGETLSGMFTGRVVTKVREWMFTVPVLAACDVSRRVRLKAGPYLSFLSSKEFSGYAYDGYLREGDPTGQKVELGHDEGERGDYDFTDDLRHWQFGVDVGADWYFSKRVGAYADLAWGLSAVFHKRFKTIEQKLYPIYGSVGLMYKL